MPIEKVIDNNGHPLDAEYEIINDKEIIYRSAGAGKNRDYNKGLEVLIEHKLTAGNAITKIILDSSRAKELLGESEDSRDVFPGRSPICIPINYKDIRLQIQRRIENMARDPEATADGGNSQKRIKIYFENVLDLETMAVAQINNINSDTNISTTEKQQITLARIGQGKFRVDMLDLWGNKCALSHIDFLPMLVASHIKPWAKCNNKERLERYNGILLCANLDALFDGGYISFDETGSLLFASEIKNKGLILKQVVNNKLNFNQEQWNYIKYHRDNIFKGSR